MSARITSAGKVYPLDRAAEPEEVVKPDEAADTQKLAKLLMRILKDVATVKRRFVPRRIDFEDRAVTAGQSLRLDHGFGCRVRWWVVEWRPTSPTDSPVFDGPATTNLNTLVLLVGNAGTVTIRVEEAG